MKIINTEYVLKKNITMFQYFETEYFPDELQGMGNENNVCKKVFPFTYYCLHMPSSLHKIASKLDGYLFIQKQFFEFVDGYFEGKIKIEAALTFLDNAESLLDKNTYHRYFFEKLSQLYRILKQNIFLINSKEWFLQFKQWKNISFKEIYIEMLPCIIYNSVHTRYSSYEIVFITRYWYIRKQFFVCIAEQSEGKIKIEVAYTFQKIEKFLTKNHYHAVYFEEISIMFQYFETKYFPDKFL